MALNNEKVSQQPARKQKSVWRSVFFFSWSFKLKGNQKLGSRNFWYILKNVKNLLPYYFPFAWLSSLSRMSSPTCPVAKTKQTTTTKLQLHSLSNMSRRTSREYQTSLNSPSVLLRWTSFKCQTLVCPKFIVPMSPQDGSLDHFQSSQGLCPIVRIRTSQCQKRCRAQQSGKKKKKKYWATPTAIIIWSAGLEVDVGGRQCHRLPICFLTSDFTNTIRNKNQRTLIVRRAGLSSWWWWSWWKYEERLEKERKECFVQTASWRNPPSHDSKGKLCV